MARDLSDEDLAELRQRAQQQVRDARAQMPKLSKEALDLILTGARSHYAWTDKPVPETLLREIYEIAAQGPTSMNSCPARFVFVSSEEGKAKLAKAMKPKNVPKMMGAPVTVIVAQDLAFWHRLDFLFPHEDRKPLFDGKDAYVEDTAYRNATLQGAWFMIAARAVGLDTGPMSGFSNDVVDKEFFDGTTLRSNFLLNLGYADETALFQKLPRFAFEDVCSFA